MDARNSTLFPVSKDSFGSPYASYNRLLIRTQVLNSLTHRNYKTRNRLEPDNDLRVAISNKEPRYSVIIDKKQHCKFIVSLYSLQ